MTRCGRLQDHPKAAGLVYRQHLGALHSQNKHTSGEDSTHLSGMTAAAADVRCAYVDGQLLDGACVINIHVDTDKAVGFAVAQQGHAFDQLHRSCTTMASIVAHTKAEMMFRRR